MSALELNADMAQMTIAARMMTKTMGRPKLPVRLMDGLANRMPAYALEAGGLGKTIEV